MVRTRKMAKLGAEPEDGQGQGQGQGQGPVPVPVPVPVPTTVTVTLGRRRGRPKKTRPLVDLDEELSQAVIDKQEPEQGVKQADKGSFQERVCGRKKEKVFVNAGTQTEGLSIIPTATATVATMTESELMEMTFSVKSQESSSQTTLDSVSEPDQVSPISTSVTPDSLDHLPDEFENAGMTPRIAGNKTRKILFQHEHQEIAELSEHNETPEASASPSLEYNLTPYSFLASRPEEEECSVKYRKGKFIPDWAKRENLVASLFLQMEGPLNLFPNPDDIKCFPGAISPVCGSDFSDEPVHLEDIDMEDLAEVVLVVKEEKVAGFGEGETGQGVSGCHYWCL